MAQATWRKEAWLGEPPHRLTWPNLPPTLKDKPKSKREGLRPQANLGLGGWSLCPQSGRFPIFLPFRNGLTPEVRKDKDSVFPAPSQLNDSPNSAALALADKSVGLRPSKGSRRGPLARGSGPRREAARPHPCLRRSQGLRPRPQQTRTLPGSASLRLGPCPLGS